MITCWPRPGKYVLPVPPLPCYAPTPPPLLSPLFDVGLSASSKPQKILNLVQFVIHIYANISDSECYEMILMTTVSFIHRLKSKTSFCTTHEANWTYCSVYCLILNSIRLYIFSLVRLVFILEQVCWFFIFWHFHYKMVVQSKTVNIEILRLQLSRETRAILLNMTICICWWLTVLSIHIILFA